MKKLNVFHLVGMSCIAGAWFLAGFLWGQEVPDYTGPSGVVTDKMWVDDYWVGAEQLYPERWCLVLDDKDMVCIPERYWEDIYVGDKYGVKK